MARTFVRQTQITGSHSIEQNLSEEQRSGLHSNGSLLQEDLNILRSALKAVSGEANYYEDPSEKTLKNLGAELREIMTGSAHFLGSMEVDGEAQFDSSAVFGAGIAVTGTGSFSSDISAVNASLSGDLSAVDATLSGDLSAVDGTFSGNISAVDATLSGDLSAVDAILSGDLSAVGGTFSGNISAVDATLSGDLSAVDATLSGDISAVNATLSGNMSAVDGTFSGNISAVDATLSGDLSAVDATLSGDLSAVDGSFSGNLTVEGNLTVNGTATYINTVDMIVEDSVIVIGSGSSDEATAGGQLGIAAGNQAAPWASILFDNSKWNLSHDLSVTGDIEASADMSAVNANLSGDLAAVDGTFSGDISAVGATFSGNMSAVDGTLSGNLSAVGGSFSGNISAIDATLSGDLSADDATLSGDLAAVSGSFSGDVAVTGEISANSAEISNISISSGEVASAAELNLKDERFEIQLSDATEAALASPRYDAVSSIVGALNKINDDLDALGAGHQKEIHAIASISSEVAMTFDMPADIQDDLNVYVNGILVHASGSAANSAAVMALGVDAAKKTGEDKIVFAFELKVGDVVTFEKF